ncbi:mediator complex, subunit Med11 [Parachaetomium inaequale]|uniref:Mediator of RNA polymerase II transcription subunit 11 n=1 Tax=Parachaetomium inaequale TaxID=2588326 RepID=A0AAN6PRZ0_9PEZI|nr:mediator complex, subunit Med11 [Parachaetomium inaequale]
MNDSTQPPGLDGGAPIDIRKPFTPGERIQQLSEIDEDTASLLVHLSSAMRALATPPGTTLPKNNTTVGVNGNTPSDIPLPDADAAETDPVSAFQTSQAAFFTTLDRIDKHLTRQILALEEAGIITLRNTGAAGAEAQQGDAGSSQQPGDAVVAAAGGSKGQAAASAAAGPKRLEPDGMGRYGSLDVGKLNMASSTVERDMERELWRGAREELARVVGEGAGGEGDEMEE